MKDKIIIEIFIIATATLILMKCAKVSTEVKVMDRVAAMVATVALERVNAVAIIQNDFLTMKARINVAMERSLV
jgi:hypothetical protein